MGAHTDKSTGTEDEFLSVRVDPPFKHALRLLAKKNERSLAGEIRVALQRHLEEAA